MDVFGGSKGVMNLLGEASEALTLGQKALRLEELPNAPTVATSEAQGYRLPRTAEPLNENTAPSPLILFGQDNARKPVKLFGQDLAQAPPPLVTTQEPSSPLRVLQTPIRDTQPTSSQSSISLSGSTSSQGAGAVQTPGASAPLRLSDYNLLIEQGRAALLRDSGFKHSGQIPGYRKEYQRQYTAQSRKQPGFNAIRNARDRARVRRQRGLSEDAVLPVGRPVGSGSGPHRFGPSWYYTPN